MRLNSEAKEMCIEMGLEFIKPISEMKTGEIVYIVYDYKNNNEMLYSFTDLKLMHNQFILQ